MKQLDLYDIQINMEDNETGMFLVSLVENPAMEIDWLMFSKNKPLKFNVDSSKHIITGVAIRADAPIYRYTNGIEYYVRFKKEGIPQIVQKFMQNGFSNLINIQHNENTLSMNDAVMVESFFINKERGICPKEFENIEDGSWCTSYKILNDTLWEEIKQGNLKGFSIEIAANLVPVEKFTNEMTEEEQDNELLNALKMETNEINIDEARAAIIDTLVIPHQNIDLNTFNDSALRYAIENKRVVMLNYDGTNATNARQVAITAAGNTIAGNSALRIYQFYGDTTSTQGWKIILEDDITSFHVLDWQAFEMTMLPGWSVESQSGANGTLVGVKYQI